MALLGQKYDYQMRPVDKEWPWQDPVEDLFDTLINPDSFHPLTEGEAERRASDDDLSYLFDQHHSSTSSSDAIDTSPMPDFDSARGDSWSRMGGFVQHTPALSSPSLQTKSSATKCASHGRTVSSDSDLLSLELALNSHLESLARSAITSHPVTSPPTPISVRPKRVATPPLLRREAYSPDRIKEPQSSRSESLSPSMKAASTLMNAHWSRPFGTGAAESRHLSLKTSSANSGHATTTPTSPAAARFKVEVVTEYPFSQHGASKPEHIVSSPLPSNPYADEIEPLSPFSNTYHAFPHPNTPVASPTFRDSFETSKAERNSFMDFQQPTTRENFDALLTPPASGQMPSASWGGADFPQPVLASSASPAFGAGLDAVAGVNKAEAWSWSPPALGQSTAGATATPNLLAGLGISGMGNNAAAAPATGLMMPLHQNQQQQQFKTGMLNFGAPMMAAPPPPNGSIAPSLVLIRPMHSPMEQSSGTGMYSSPPPMAAQTAPMHGLPIQYPPPSPHPQQDTSPLTRRHHRRHHTTGTAINTAHLSQLHNGPRTPSTSPTPSTPRSHKRSRSSHHTRRKSSGNNGCGSGSGNGRVAPRPAGVGFVNFTPDDSRKILTGVAPSGSSKTKARREKEAAERRRKLSEAAKKAVLEAGGDLETLEREGLLVLGEGLDGV